MRILVIRFSALGDVAMTIPVLLEVLEQNPDVQIDFLTRPFMAKLIPHHPRLQAIGADVDKEFKGFRGLRKLSSKLKAVSEYDAIADLHFVLRSRILTYFLQSSKVKVASLDKGREEKAKLIRKKNKVRLPLKHMTERYAEVFRTLGVQANLTHHLHPSSERSGIGFAPFAQHRGKAWPLESARKLLELLQNDGRSILLFGAPNEEDLLAELSRNLTNVSIHRGKGIASDIEAMKNLEMMISMDSANMHLASLAQIPVVSIWGATHPNAGFLGYGQSLEFAVQVSTDQLSCRPCSVFGNKPCYRGDWACLNRISPEEVASLVKRLLSEQ